MKSRICVFIFFVILLLKAERSSGLTIINNIAFDFNENLSGGSLEHAYSRDILVFGSCTPLRISKVKTHLKALEKASAEQPECNYYEYLLGLSNDHSKLQQLADITDKIHNFVAESKGAISSFRFGNGSITISGMFSSSGSQRRFEATSAQNDNKGVIKACFVQHELELEQAAMERQKAAEELEKELAHVAIERNEALKAAAAAIENAAIQVKMAKMQRKAAATQKKAATQNKKAAIQIKKAAAANKKRARNVRERVVRSTGVASIQIQ